MSDALIALLDQIDQDRNANALPKLTAALRAVLALADEWDETGLHRRATTLRGTVADQLVGAP